jgi:hypothetical protein
MTYITIKTNYAVLAHISAWFWQVFGTVSIKETVATKGLHDAALLSQKAWSDDWDSEEDAHWDSYGV